MNPEFLRNLWIEMTVPRLIAAPLVLGALFLLAWYVGGKDLGEVLVEGAMARFVATGDAAAQAALLRRLIEAGLPVASFAAAKADLQDAYLTLLKDNRARGHALPPPAAAPTAPAARP